MKDASARCLFLLITTQKYHATRAQAILQTWGKDCLDDVYFMSDAGDANQHFIDLNVPSDYTSAVAKTLRGIEYAIKNHFANYDWFFIGDDDTFVYVKHLKEFLAQQDPQKPCCYCQVLRHYRELPNLRYPSGGAGYVLSKPAILKLQPLLANATLYGYSDVTIGVCLEEAKIPLHDTPGIYSQPPEIMAEELQKQGIDYLSNKPITFHYIKPERMQQLYDSRLFF